MLTAFLALAPRGGVWEIAHRLGWLWFVLLALLVLAGWIGTELYGDHLVRQGRYDRALKLVPLMALSRAGRSRLRAGVLTEAGRYQEAARAQREVLRAEREALRAEREATDYMPGTKASSLTRVKVYDDVEGVGNVLMETGHFREAERFFVHAARLDPFHSGWATGMAEVLLRQGVFPGTALEHAEKAHSLFRRGAERVTDRCRLGAILATKAWALAACGRGAEAQALIDAALKSPTRKTKGPLAQVHYKAGMSFLLLSDLGRAEQHFARGIKLDPTGRWGRLCAEALRRRGG